MKKLILFLCAFLITSAQGFCTNLKELSLEQKVGQLFIVHFHGKEASVEAELLIQKAHVGGFIYYGWSNTLESFEQVKDLSLSLNELNQKYCQIPLFLSTDQEGGRVNRLKIGFSQFPSNRELASLDITEIAYQTAAAQAKELKAAGINMNYAPVVDVDSNPKNPIIGNRSYSSDPDKVIIYSKAALAGYKDNGVLAVIKHFPGHGDVSIDSHSNTPMVDKTPLLLEQIHWKPFSALKNEAEAMMTAHVLYSKVDPDHPASVSSKLLTDLLRNSWRFEGLVISDSLIMKGLIKSEESVEKAALSALLAGTDLLCFGGKLLNEPAQDELTPSDILRIHSFLVDAVKTGKLSEKRIDESLARIFKAKEKYCTNLSATPLISSEEKSNHAFLQKEITLLLKIDNATAETCEKIAKKVWHNETGSSKKKLLYWNPQEDFLSLGIGHFIWYPKDKKTSFEEGFPDYLAYLKSQKADIPYHLQNATCCLWGSREVFIEAQDSPQTREILEWLGNTMDLQGKFLIHKVPSVIHKIFSACSSLKEKENILKVIQDLTNTQNGFYALVDYLNFKGSGLQPSERYKTEGWGLFQVLIKLTTYSNPVTARDFAFEAKNALTLRVKNAPDPEKEKKWLTGWINRVNTYDTM
ncbi:MAG: glycoside hydrolase family 3 protein [Chlamydiae bacterium]|nr:glycoside hydrolase family 3 protein [Chlamydiota bacterium]